MSFAEMTAAWAALRREAAWTDLHGHLHQALTDRARDWDHGLIEDAHLGDRFDKRSMSLRELSDELYRRGHSPDVGPRDMERALDEMADKGHIQRAPVAGEWEAN